MTIEVVTPIPKETKSDFSRMVGASLKTVAVMAPDGTAPSKNAQGITRKLTTVE